MIQELFNIANNLKDKGDLDNALRLIDQVIKLGGPENFQYINFKATILSDLNRQVEAEQFFEKTVYLATNESTSVQAMINLGNCYFDNKKTEKAIEIFNNILKIEPQNNAALNNLGNIQNSLGMHELAICYFNSVIKNNPTYSKAYNNKGNALRSLRKLDEALDCYEKATILDPSYAAAYCNKGNVLTDLGDHIRAIESYSIAIELDPHFAQAYNNRGNSHLHSAQYLNAINDYSKTLELDADFPYTRGLLIFCKQKVCDWNRIDDEINILVDKINSKKLATLPFPLIPVIDDPKVQKSATELCCSTSFPKKNVLSEIHQKKQKNKINVAYYSADYSVHPTTHLLAEVFELHNRDYFRVINFSIGPPINDEMRMRVIDASDVFIDAHQKSDLEIAELSRELEIDIAIDLKGHTYNSRPGIFYFRCAPIQINFLGYPGTAGTAYHDYLISDKNVIPQKLKKHYSEKIIYMPYTYLCYDRKKPLKERSYSRSDLGLPEQGIVFACFNNNYKITKKIFDAWMTILSKTSNSVLWLFEDNTAAGQNLKLAAIQSGIDPERIIFAKPMLLSDHLDRHHCADIFLDTFPCNAHTTALDALWMGLPIVTLYGNSYASRVAMSMLNTLGLKKYATRSVDEYIKIALRLSKSKIERTKLRARILNEENRARIFDCFNFTKYLELAYINCLKKYNMGTQDDINLSQIYPFMNH